MEQIYLRLAGHNLKAVSLFGLHFSLFSTPVVLFGCIPLSFSVLPFLTCVVVCLCANGKVIVTLTFPLIAP